MSTTTLVADGREGALEGARLGPYQLERRIGAGGTSYVYRAGDTVLDRVVAVKVARDRTRYGTARDEFERQARTLGARIDHPAIVRVHGHGQEGELPYLAMELVDGRPLELMLAERVRLRWTEALVIARDVAEGLAAAHRLGVIHRDVKPANIMVTTAGHGKLADFSSQDARTLLNLTGGYDYFGTPGYSAPEQVRGEERHIDGRSDLFALGVVLYEMLEGQPYHGRGETERLIARTLETRAPTKLKPSPGVPARVAKLVNHLVRPNPRRRPADAVAVIARIDECLDKD